MDVTLTPMTRPLRRRFEALRIAIAADMYGKAPC